MQQKKSVILILKNTLLSHLKNGFKTQQTIIDWHISGWYLVGNLFFGGMIGYLLIDPISGDMYYLDKEVNLNMSPN